jgi:alkaline phosphatase
MNSTSRRSFIKGAGLAGLATAFVPQKASASTPSPAKHPAAKNLIFLVVDGMCNGTLGLSHHWHLRNRKQPLNWMRLYEREDLVRSFQDTASASSPVTDSAAAASAWGSGHNVMNRSINTAEDGTVWTPLYELARNARKRTGLVSTCRISHATPAGFASSVDHRDKEHEILRQYLERKVDVLLGGGRSKFLTSREDGTDSDLFPEFEAGGYTLVKDRKRLAALRGNEARVLGIFSESHVPYALDRQNDPALKNVPSLPDMFGAALKNLEGSSDGFLLQVEGGRVDHAGHANDPGAILHEMLEFDACIPMALEFIEKHPDTLLIVTTDHGTGGCQLDGLGSGYNESGPALDRINQFNHSFEWLERRYRTKGEFSAEDFVRATGITPTGAQGRAIQALLEDPEVKYLTSALTEIVSKELTKVTATGWSSNNHTAEMVELLAFGPGSAGIPSFIRNEQLHGIMRGALGI